MQTLRSFLCVRHQPTSPRTAVRPARTSRLAFGLIALACVVAGTGMAQQFADFETGMDGFSIHSNITSNHVVAAATSSLVSSTGANSLRVSKSPDGWSWTVRVDGHAVSNNVAFHTAISNALSDTANSYDLAFEAIYVPGDIPGAGTTDTTWLYTLPRMESDSGATNYFNTGLSGSDIENLTSNETQTVRMPLDHFNLSPTSPYYILYLSLNGDWGAGTASVYYDNFRVELTPDVPTTGVVFDFNSGLDGWSSNFGGEIGLEPDLPTLGETSLYVKDDFPGKVLHGRVTKYPGSEHPFYDYVRSAVRDDPSRYSLEFDFIIHVTDLPPSPLYVRPCLAWNGDDGFAWNDRDLAGFGLDVDLTSITGDLVIPMQVPLDTWFTVYNQPWTPSYIQLNAGVDMDMDAPYSIYKFYYDNFAIRKNAVVTSTNAVITDISVPGNVSLSWESQTGIYYNVAQSTTLNPDWTQVASDLAATPPLNTYAGYAPSGAAEFFRVERTDTPSLEVPLFSFETGLEDWAPSPVEIVATNQFATDGTNSLALIDDENEGDWDTYYQLDAGDFVSNIPPVWVAISNALVDTSNQWYIAADFTWDGLSIPTDPVPTYLQMQVAFNSSADWGGWRHHYYMFDLSGGNIVSLIANSNSVSKTWGVPLEDTGWDTDVATNSYLQIHWGLKGNWGVGDDLTAYMDNWRLTTVEP